MKNNNKRVYSVIKKILLIGVQAFCLASICFIQITLANNNVENKQLAEQIKKNLFQYPHYSATVLKVKLSQSLNQDFINDVCKAQCQHQNECLYGKLGHRSAAQGTVNILKFSTERQKEAKVMLNEDVAQIKFHIRRYLNFVNNTLMRIATNSD